VLVLTWPNGLREAEASCWGAALAATTRRPIDHTPVLPPPPPLQLYHWSVIEAADGGFRNFGMPMTVEPMYRNDVLWGFVVGMYKDGVKLTDIGIGFDNLTVDKHE
jgi:hypothetical protein